MHLDGKSIADEINGAITDALGGPFINDVAAHVADSTANAVTTGVITPANAAYTLADQTALADAVLSIDAQIDALRTTVNAILAALQDAGLMA